MSRRSLCDLRWQLCTPEEHLAILRSQEFREEGIHEALETEIVHAAHPDRIVDRESDTAERTGVIRDPFFLLILEETVQAMETETVDTLTKSVCVSEITIAQGAGEKGIDIRSLDREPTLGCRGW